MAPPESDSLDAAVLHWVLQRHPAPVHREEFGHAFAGDDWPASTSSLVADGVLHREGGLYLASRASVRVSELLG